VYRKVRTVQSIGKSAKILPCRVVPGPGTIGEARAQKKTRKAEESSDKKKGQGSHYKKDEW